MTHRTKRITFLVGDDYHVVTPMEWQVEGKWIHVAHEVDRDHYSMPRHLVEDEFEKAKDHHGLSPDLHLVDVLIATSDRRIMQVVQRERRQAA